MRASDDYFDDFDDVGFSGPPKVQRLIDEQRRRVKRKQARSRHHARDVWDDEWHDDYDCDSDYEYPDYDEEEFDSYSITR